MVTAETLEMTFGELVLSRRGEAALIGVAGSGGTEIDGTPEALREWVAFDAAGRYRPLSGYRSLRRGWRMECGAGMDRDAALDIVYPLARKHQDAWQRGSLRVVPLQETLKRQSGRYEQAVALTERGRTIVGDVLCGGCVRAPLWRGAAVPHGGMPCPEACSVLVSLCREAERWERGIDAERAETSGDAGFADFETRGNEIREAVLAALAEGPTGGLNDGIP